MSRALHKLGFAVAMLAVAYDSRAAEPDPDQVMCLAKNIYHEARGEGRLGMLAVASVTLNRVEDHRWGDTVCEVVYQRKQFSWANDGEQPILDSKAWLQAHKLAHYAMTHRKARVTKATHYVHLKLDGRKGWMKGMKRLGTIGRHVFYDDRKH